jgi:hypothetical protein
MVVLADGGGREFVPRTAPRPCRPGGAVVARGVVVAGHAVTMADGVALERVPVFVSHAGPDTGWAEWVAWQLRAAGHVVELDAWDWQAGESFVARMRSALQVRGVVMVALFSEAYFEPGRFSMAEWDAARTAAQAGEFRIVPVRVEAVTPPIFDSALIFVDVFGVDPATARARVLAGVRGKGAPAVEPGFPGAVGSSGAVAAGGPRLPGMLPAVWRVPPRNPAFTGRDQLLADMRVTLSVGGALALQALQGMGGVGKTSLAIEYAHRFAADFEAVWWIDADSPALIAEQYRELAVATRVVGADADVPTGAAAARAWLRRESGWLVVFDNAEDPDLVLPLLAEGAGQLVVTSRDPRWHQVGVTSVALVDVFARSESVALLRTHLPAISEADAEAVAEPLGDLPLAVAQAGAFMAESGMSPDRYLDGLRQHLGEAMSEGKPTGYPRPLAASVRLLVERVASDDPAAVQLLRVAAFLAPEPIPTAWFATAAAAGLFQEPSAATAASPFALPKAFTRLARYGLVRLSADGNPILHRLTAAILQDDLDEVAHAAVRRRAEAMIVSVHAGDDGSNPDTWAAWADLMPHVLALNPADTDNSELRALTIHGCWALRSRGDFRAALHLTQSLRDAWRQTLGEDHPHTLTAANILATCHGDAGNYAIARELSEDVMARRRRVLGEDHPDTLRLAGDLAIDLRVLGEVEAARELNEDTLARLRRVLGDDHPDTLTSANNLAADLRVLGEVEAARELNEDTLARRRRVLGEDHPDTLISAHNLAIDRRELDEPADDESQ